MSSGIEVHVERGRIRAIHALPHGVVVHSDGKSYTFPERASLYPGFVDAHVHLLGLGKRLTTPSLYQADSEDACIAILQQTAIPSNGWIQAMGWNQMRWDSSVVPTSQSLTAAFPSTPVVCSRVDGHALWVNSAALERAGIHHPTGLLVDAEMNEMFQKIPKATTQDIEQQLQVAAQAFARAGVTEVHDMDVAPDVVAVTRSLSENATLPIRVQSFVSAQHNEWVTANLLPAGGERQRTVGVKMYADGALGSLGASLLEPYNIAPHQGTALLTRQQIVHNTLQAIQAGWWAVAVHAIGDAAVRTVLDAFQEVRSSPDGSDIILRIEHAQHVHADDVMRFADLNVIASVQPTHAESDAEMAIAHLGKHRMGDAYRWRSLLDSGVQVCFGTDAPIESEHSLRTFDVAVNGTSSIANVDRSHELVSPAQALLAQTTWAHAAVGMDHRRGSISVGMDADLVVLGSSITESGTKDIRNVKVLATFTGGVYHPVQ